MNYPQCPRPGHEHHRVVRDGTYGARLRQRFRCVADGVCDQCGNPVHAYEGPVNMAGSMYEVRGIAQALLDVAGGASYTEAARRVRVRFRGDSSGHRKTTSVENGQTVADWLNQFGPVLIDARVEAAWLECLVVDNTEFRHHNQKTGVTEQLFAWGYEPGDTKGRLWRVEAAQPTGTATGRPSWVRYRAGPEASYGTGTSPSSAASNGTGARCRSGADPPARTPPLAERPETAWPSSANLCRTSSRLRSTRRRASLPAHYSTGALEAKIADLRGLLERRRWTFRNQARLNLLLGLARLRINRMDDVRSWAVVVREHLDANGGRAAYPRRIEDPITRNIAGERIYSLRG